MEFMKSIIERVLESEINPVKQLFLDWLINSRLLCWLGFHFEACSEEVAGGWDEIPFCEFCGRPWKDLGESPRFKLWSRLYDRWRPVRAAEEAS